MVWIVVGISGGLLLLFILITAIGIIAFIMGTIFSLSGIYLLFKMYVSVDFFMGENTLTVKRKALLWRKVTTYNPGELQKVDFYYELTKSQDSEEGGNMYNYSLVIIEKNGKVESIFSISYGCPKFTTEEIGYFLYYINTHINTNMVA